MNEKSDKKSAYEVIIDYLERQAVAFGDGRGFFGGQLMEAEEIAGVLIGVLAAMIIPPEARQMIHDRLLKLRKESLPLKRCLRNHTSEELVWHFLRSLKETYKPTLLDIARRAVLEADKEWAKEPIELVDIITNWLVPGSKALGLTVTIYYHSEEPAQPPEMRLWLRNEAVTSHWPRPNGTGLLTQQESAYADRRPRELGEVMTLEGQKYVLVGFLQSEHWSSGIVDSAAFVPAEEFQL